MTVEQIVDAFIAGVEVDYGPTGDKHRDAGRSDAMCSAAAAVLVGRQQAYNDFFKTGIGRVDPRNCDDEIAEAAKRFADRMLAAYDQTLEASLRDRAYAFERIRTLYAPQETSK
jgi:hypothetical protein